MNRFFIESFKENFSMFKSEPIYLIYEQFEGNTKQVGKGFNTFEEAVNICDWLNNANEEINDYMEAYKNV